MDKIKVTLDEFTTPRIALKATGKPYRNNKPTMKLLENIAKSGHTSVLEHIVFHFDIENVSRVLLQEFSRHRIASETVESTRFVLVKSLKEINTEDGNSVYVYFTIPEMFKRHPHVEMFYRKHIGMVIDNIRHMSDMLKEIKENGDDLDGERPTDFLKYMLVEAFRTNIYWTINMRSLINFIHLRNSKNAHPEIRMLARYIQDIIRTETPYGNFLDIV